MSNLSSYNLHNTFSSFTPFMQKCYKILPNNYPIFFQVSKIRFFLISIHFFFKTYYFIIKSFKHKTVLKTQTTYNQYIKYVI